MQRVATLMRFQEGMEDAYRQAHRRVWPELIAAGQRVGIRNYTIFVRDQARYS